jgi:hypothetical protein
MNLRALARVSGLLGGLCWVLRLLLDRSGSGAGAVDPLHWAGLVLLFVALLGLGATLVKEVWLQTIVGIAFPLLVWSVVEVLHRAGDPLVVDAVAGVLIAAACVASLRRKGGGDQKPPRRHAGAHAR